MAAKDCSNDILQNRLHCSNLPARGLEDHMAEAWWCFSPPSCLNLCHQQFIQQSSRILFWVVVCLLLQLGRKTLLAFEYSSITLGAEFPNSRVTVTSWCPTSSGSCSSLETWEIHPFRKNSGHKIPKLMTRRQWCRLAEMSVADVPTFEDLWFCTWDLTLRYISFLHPLFSFLLVLGSDGYSGICRILAREGTPQIIFPPPLDSEVLSRATLIHPQVDEIWWKKKIIPS